LESFHPFTQLEEKIAGGAPQIDYPIPRLKKPFQKGDLEFEILPIERDTPLNHIIKNPCHLSIKFKLLLGRRRKKGIPWSG
jgi:hypothetical protein